MKKSICLKQNLLGIATLLLISSFIVAGCNKSQPLMPNPESNIYVMIPTNSIVIKSTEFTPRFATVVPGTTVTWTNNSAVVQTVTSETGRFDSGNIPSNGTFSVTFPRPGTFNYHSASLTAMSGTIIVSAGGSWNN
jgi:plastocyanin